MVHLGNLSKGPRLYMKSMPRRFRRNSKPIGLRGLTLRLKRDFPRLALDCCNRSKEDFGEPHFDRPPWFGKELAG